MSHELQSRATHRELVKREHAFEARLRRVPKQALIKHDAASQPNSINDDAISSASTASEVIKNARISKLALERAVSAAEEAAAVMDKTPQELRATVQN